MDKYEVLALLVLSLSLLPIGYLVFWIVRIVWSPGVPPLAPVDSESWICNERQLTITFRKGLRPEQKAIDEIKSNIDHYEAMVAARIRDTEGTDADFRTGLRLEGISFPVDDDEQGEYDFSISYISEDGSDMVLDAYFRDGEIQEIVAGD